MKQRISVFILAVFLSQCIALVGCSKSSTQQKSAASKPVVHTDSTQQTTPPKTYNYGDASCTCSGDVCGSNCTLSDCCVCAPAGYAVACGCFLGMAICKGEKVDDSKPGEPIIYSDNVVIHPDKLVAVRDYLIARGFSTVAYNNALDALLNDVNYTPGMGAAQVVTLSLYYDLFNQYEALVLALEATQRDALNNFVNSL